MGNTEGRLSKKTLIAYGMGDFASNLTNTFIGSYLTIFYTDQVGLAPAIVSMIMLIVRIWDGVFDPVFGAVAERNTSKRGRFRSYIYYFTPFLALASVLMFTKLGSGHMTAVWAFVTYMIYGMLFTVVNLSYGSLSTVMTVNPLDISLLTSYRMMGTNLSAVLLSAFSPVILSAISGGNTYTVKSYTLLILFYALLSIPMFYFVYANCKEVIKPLHMGKQVPLSASLKTVATNRPLMLIFAMMIIAMTAFFGRMGTVIYYIIYVVGRPDLIGIFMALPSVMTIIGIFITKNYVLKLGKKKMCLIGYAGAGISLVAVYLVGTANIGLLIALHACYGFFCFAFPIPMSMIVEAVNYQEDKTGVRSDGISYATTSLAVKFGSAFGPSIALLIMGAAGYVANTQQTKGAVSGINLSINLIFALIFFMALIPLSLYPLDAKKNAEIQSRLLQRETENKQ